MEPAISPMSSPATSKTFKPDICSTKTVDPAIKRQASSLATSKVDLSVKQLASSRSSLRRPLTSRHHSFLRRHRSVTWIRFCEQLLPSFSFFLGQTTLRHPWSIEFESKSYSNCHTAHLYRRHSRSREIASSSASHPCEIQLYHKRPFSYFPDAGQSFAFPFPPPCPRRSPTSMPLATSPRSQQPSAATLYRVKMRASHVTIRSKWPSQEAPCPRPLRRLFSPRRVAPKM